MRDALVISMNESRWIHTYNLLQSQGVFDSVKRIIPKIRKNKIESFKQSHLSAIEFAQDNVWTYIFEDDIGVHTDLHYGKEMFKVENISKKYPFIYGGVCCDFRCQKINERYHGMCSHAYAIFNKTLILHTMKTSKYGKKDLIDFKLNDLARLFKGVPVISHNKKYHHDKQHKYPMVGMYYQNRSYFNVSVLWS